MDNRSSTTREIKAEREREREREWAWGNKEKLKSSMTANSKHFRLFKFCKSKAEYICQGLDAVQGTGFY